MGIKGKRTTENIYIDEAGNTGQDLLNAAQGVFVLASNNYSDRELRILSSLFSNLNELHFIKLKESNSGRIEILSLLDHPLIIEKHINCFIAHKAYVATAQIVDRLIEPVMYDKNIDIYKGGTNIAMANFIYHLGMGQIWDKLIFERMLKAFMEMMRKKREEDIEEFYNSLEVLSNHPNTKERDLIDPILESKHQIQEILHSIDKFALDVTLSGFYILCDKWYKKTKNKLRIIQDDSKQIEHYKEHIDFTTKLKIEQKNIGYDSRRMIYPTQISALNLVPSDSSLGVQISDILASSIAFMYNNKNTKQKNFVEKIKISKLVNLTNHYTVWPNEKVTPEQLEMNKGEGENILDFLAMHMLTKNQRL